MELATLARPYAEAVFKLAKETQNFAKWSEMLNFLKIVVEEPQFAAIAANPHANKDMLLRLLLDLGSEQFNEHGQNLVKMLVENHRLMVIAPLVSQYEALRAEHEGFIQVELISTYAVKSPQKEEVESLLKKRFSKEINLNITIDRKLLGGWIIRVGDQVLDLSVRGRLQQLVNELR